MARLNTDKQKSQKPGAGLKHVIAVVMAIVFIAAFLGFS
jgi:hypothetical protein